MTAFASLLLGGVLALSPPDATPTDVWTDVGKNQVTFAAGRPATPQDGNIGAAGAYSRADGWSVQSVTLKCAPSRGGELLSQAAVVRNGKWSAEIAPVRAGTYDVRVEMDLMNPTTKERVTIGSVLKRNIVVR